MDCDVCARLCRSSVPCFGAIPECDGETYRWTLCIGSLNVNANIAIHRTSDIKMKKKPLECAALICHIDVNYNV